MEGIKGLENLKSEKAISAIEPLLNDPVWLVRLQAAMTFKSFGSEVLSVLWNRDERQEPLANEVSKYILALPE